MITPAESYSALRSGAVAFDGSRDLVRVVGPDALSYLEGQCSQSIAGKGPGEAADAFLLNPQGKIDALVRILIVSGEEAVVAVEAGYGEAVLERLRRFKIRVKAELELANVPTVEVVGPEVTLPTQAGAPAWPGPFMLELDWPGLEGFELLGTGEPPAGIELGDPSALATARIEAGMPMGYDLAGGIIPQESGIVARTVSFTKGCYTGQELVARLDARGNRVPKRLVGLVVEPGETPPVIVPGAALVIEGREIGSVTSASDSAASGRVVALAYLKREVTTPAAVELADGSGVKRRGEVVDLPLWGSPLIG